MIDTCQVLNRGSSIGSSVPAREAFQSPRWNFNHMWDRLSQETCQHLRWLFNTMGDLSCRWWCGRSMETPTGCCKWHEQNAWGVFLRCQTLDFLFTKIRLHKNHNHLLSYVSLPTLKWFGMSSFPPELWLLIMLWKGVNSMVFPQKIASFVPASHRWSSFLGHEPVHRG